MYKRMYPIKYRFGLNQLFQIKILIELIVKKNFFTMKLLLLFIFNTMIVILFND